MRTSIPTPEDRARQRLQRAAWHTRTHATPTQARQIRQLIDAVTEGSVTVKDAHAALAALQRQQQEKAA
jgi:hypothetical protein